MSKFVLTAQLQLKAPTNTKQVVSQMKRQLSGVNVSLNVKGAPQAQKQLAKINQQCKNVNKTGQRMGKTFGLALNRFAAFTVATRAVSLFTNGLANATKEAIAFERELVKISQVTGKTLKELSGLTNTITNLSVGLGTSSKDLLATTRILAQAGIQARDLDVALTSLAKTTLAPTFEDITKTAEGAVAILAQFGQGVGALEQQLGAINAVAGQFAVESGDLISVVRRTGGVFKAAGGDLNELLALFTSVRATTRESAESIATGLRTIFTRIQRPKTIEFLKQFGVELTDLNGKFVGPYDAVRQLSKALSGLGEGDIRFVQIAEELGGFRQIGKVIPLLQQFETAERARQAAIEGGGSLTKDAATAQQALAVQITKVKEEFLALVRSVSQTGSFQALVKTTLDLASALISVADALKPIIPLLTLFAGIKMAKGIAGFGKGLGGALKGGPQGFASGGIVPGTGNRDTVPAMLTPGEFVIRKSSVSKLGAGTLAQMNSNKYAVGGAVDKKITDVAKESTFNSNLVYRGKKQQSKKVGEKFRTQRNAHQFTENDKVQFNIVEDLVRMDKRLLDKKDAAIMEGRNASQQGLAFERYLKNPKVNKLKAQSNPRYAGNEALDGITPGNTLAEVKRTAENTSKSKYADKLLRDQLKHGAKLATSQLTEPIENADPIKLPTLKVFSLDKSNINKDKKKGGKQSKPKFFGGDIQKFALGGIATANRVGFGILDPDRKQADAKVPVTRAQVKAAIAAPPYSGNKSQQRGLDKEMASSSKNYNLTRQGLNKKTSDNFYNVITEEAAKGVGVAAQRLSQDLSLGSVTPDPNSMKVMQGIIRKSGSEMGGLFERTVNLMDNRGKFSPQAPGAPFDEPGGISGALRDNYDKLPSSWVDLKTSYREASVPNMTTKIVNELAKTYSKTPTFIKAKNDKTKSKGPSATEAAATKLRQEKQQARMAKQRKAAGYNYAKGGAAPSDTVPAMLTPGEFVINAKSASKIGKANLNRMNKQGVQGFATGGVVQRFANGGAPKPQGLGYPGSMTGSKETTKQLQVEEKTRKLLNTKLKQQIPVFQDLYKNSGFLPNTLKVWDNAIKTSAASSASSGSQTSKVLQSTGQEVQKGENRLVTAIKNTATKISSASGPLKTSLIKLAQTPANAAKNLYSGFNTVATKINNNGHKVPEAFDKAAIMIKNTKGGQKVAKVLKDIGNKIKNVSSAVPGALKNAGNKLVGSSSGVKAMKGSGENAAALKTFSQKLKSANVGLVRRRKALTVMNQSMKAGTSAQDSAKKATQSIGAGFRKLSTATTQATNALQSTSRVGGSLGSGAVSMDQRRKMVQAGQSGKMTTAAKGGGGGGGGGGGRDAMGAFFAIQGIAMMIPKIEGATEGMGAVQNASGDLTMQLGTLAFVASSLGLPMNALTVGIGAAAGAAFAATRIIDAYTGVHEKAKQAVKTGDIENAGKTAVSSQAQNDVNKFAMGLAVVGGTVGAVFGPGGVVVGAIVGGLIGIGAAILSKLLPESLINSFRNNVLTLFGADSTQLIAARATAAAALQRAELMAAKNAERAAIALKSVEDGSTTLAEAFKTGELTRSVEAYKVAVDKQRKLELEANAKAQSAKEKAVGEKTGIAGGAVAGAAAGALIGSFVPVIGTAVGAAVGGVIGGIGGYMASQSDENAQLASDQESKRTKELQASLNKEIKKLMPQFTKLGREMFVAGEGFSGFKDKIEETLKVDFEALDPAIQIQLATNFKNNAIAVAESTKAFAQINLGLRPLETIGAGLNTSLGRITSVLNGKFNTLGSAVDIVGAALSGAEVDAATFDTSLAQINSSFKKFGVSDQAIGKLNKNFKTLRVASGGFQKALDNVRTKLLADDTGGSSVKDLLVDEISNLDGLDDEGKRIIKNIFGSIDFSGDDIQKLREGNMEPILAKLDEAGKKAFEGVQKASQELVSAQNQLVSITQKRVDAELKMIAAQKKAIGLQEEAAGILAELGGEKLSATERAGFAQARLSADLRGGAGSDGSTSGIMSRIGSIQSQAGAATSRLSSVAGGAEGDTMQFAQDQQSLATANRELDSLAEYARKRVQIYKDELAIVTKKNSLEKSSLEKLISGDVSGFVEGQSAAAAQVALTSGNQSLANLFSSSSLGTAFGNLEGQGLSDTEKRSAASVALGPGFASDRNVGVLTGTTSEEKGIKQNIAEQAGILKAIAPAIQQIGSADFQVATAGLQKANDEFVAAQQRAAKASADFAASQEKVNQQAADQASRSQEAEKEADKAIESAQKQREKQEKDAGQEAGNVDLRVGAGSSVTIASDVDYKSKGGTVYASRGMFIPRGTDTVPAMLTPGEFVVNRASVQRGNNLQVLQAMNGNSAAAAPAQGMSKGGPVYMDGGGTVPSTPDMTAMFKTFESSARMFNDAVTKLAGFKLNIQLDPTNVNVNLNGGTFLNQMKKELKDELLVIVSERIRGSSFDFTGDINMDPYTQNLS